MPKVLFPDLSTEIYRPLLEAAERVARIAPWEFMSDLEVIGMRDDSTGELYAACILGALGTMFAVVIYRNDAGRRLLHHMLTERAVPASSDWFEEMDCLKIEWCPKKELTKGELRNLEAAGFKPKGRGPVWPKFQSCQPGWYPWCLNEAEARLMTGLLKKVARFVCLRAMSGSLHQEPLEAQLPIIPAGEESTLRREDIDWVPFIPRPASLPDPVTFSAAEQESLLRLPIRKGFIAEMMTPLSPDLSFLDEKAGRPCLARVGFIVDRASEMVLCARMAHGAAPLKDAVGGALLEALTNAKSRPGKLCVENERLVAVLGPACQAVGIPVHHVPLQIAVHAWVQFAEYFSRQ